ncbi:MAG: hypothetical protein IPG99_02950 [Ignavibacteria bacterium]|nr:hypothetical protein [Ignavibacteria bacterium]
MKKHIDDKKLHRYTQCAAELPIKIYSFISINLKCDSCALGKYYIPDDRIRALEYYVLIPLAKEQAYPFKQKAKNDREAQSNISKHIMNSLMENVPDKKNFMKET